MRVSTQLLYSALLAAGVLPAFLRKVAKSGFASVHVAERLAQAPLPDTKPLWINAASVGELAVATRLVSALREQHPDLPVFLTHSAEAARTLAPKQLGCAAHALPLDFAGVMQRFLSRLQPRLCLLIEQELWPNLVNQVTKQNIGIAVVNGRLSARSARRHARHRWLTKEMFSKLDLVVTGTRADAARFKFLGTKNVAVSGNIKFDALPAPDKVSRGHALRTQLAAAFPDKPVLLLASTRPAPTGLAEEEILLNAIDKLRHDWVVVLVPRHPERFTVVSQLLQSRCIDHERYSALGDTIKYPFILGDTMGDMDSYYACADVAFVGASLVNCGGQNLMEALAQSKPVVVGPYTNNFAELVSQGTNCGAVRQVRSATEITNVFAQLLGDANLRKQMGNKGLALAQAQHGATEKTLALLQPLLVNSGLIT